MNNTIRGLTGSIILLAACAGQGVAGTFYDKLTGSYNANATWVGGAANPAGITADTVYITNVTVNITNAFDATSDTIYISGPGAGTLSSKTNDALNGATVYIQSGGTNTRTDVVGPWIGAALILNGGVLDVKTLASSKNLGGALTLSGSSVFSATPSANNTFKTTNSSLVVSTPGLVLTITNTAIASRNWVPVVDAVTFNENTEVSLVANGGGLVLTPGSLVLPAGKTLTVSGTRDMTVNGNNTGLEGAIDWNSAGTLTANASNALGTAAINLNTGTLSSAAEYGFGTSKTILIKSGCTVTRGDVVDTWAGATLVLTGGVLNVGTLASSKNLGGEIFVATSAVYMANASSSGSTSTNSSLTVSVFGTVLTLSNYNSTAANLWRPVISTVSINESAELSLVSAGSKLVFTPGSLVLPAGKTLTVSGTRDMTVNGNNTGLEGTIDWNSAGTLTANASNCLASRVNVSAGTFSLNADSDFTCNGADIYFMGGSMSHGNQVGSTYKSKIMGGNIYVVSNLTMTGSSGWELNPTFGLLDISGSSTNLSFLGNNGTQPETVTFTSVTVRVAFTLGLGGVTSVKNPGHMILAHPAVYAGRTVTLVTNVASTAPKLTLTNTLSIALNGSADLLSFTNFVAFTNTGAASSFTNKAVFDGKGLWTLTKDNNTGIDVAMTNHLGLLNSDDTVTFGSSSPAGYVAFNALVSGTVYKVTLDLLTPANTNVVMTELAKNTNFTAFAVVDAGGRISFTFTARADGTFYYAWQNIGDTVEGVGLGVSGSYPEISDTAPGDVTYHSALLNGTLSSTGLAETVVWVYWATQNCTNNLAAWQANGMSNAFGAATVVPSNYTFRATNLLANTQYFYRYYATNSNMAVWATPVTNFTTGLAPTLSVGDAAIMEGESAPVSLVFPVTMSSTSDIPVTVLFATAGNTALSGSDYTYTNGVVTFDPGSTNATIAVEILNDLENPEFPDETFYLNLSSPTNATLSDNQAVGTIYNYSGGAGAAVNVDEGATNITATQAQLRGQVTAGSPYPEVTIYWWPEGGTTTAIPKGVQSGAFSNDIGGLLANMTYYYYCFATNASGTDTSATANFRTEGPQISIAPVTVNEPSGSGTTNARFAVTLSATSAVAVQVGFASAGGTAVQGADFDETNGTLVISAGLVATSITAVVHGDADYTEGDETFTMTLGSPLEATIASGQGTGTGTIRELSIVLTNGTLTIDTTLGTMTHSVGGQVATGAIMGHTNMENGTWTYGLCTFQLPSVLILDSGVTVVLQGTNGLAIESGSDIRVGCVLNADGGSATTNNANAGIGGSGVCGGWSGVDYVLQAGVVGKGPGCGAKGRFGAGGAGYGGHGGAGYGTVSGGDSLATGGTAYAEYKLNELIGGSSGGGSEGGGANQWGAGSGAGGGAVMLSAGGEVRIEATGAVSVNGGDGGIAAASRCAGGGSGGSVLLKGMTVTVNGILRANGGRSLGTAQKGGGGGGGRISILSTNPAVLGGSLSVTGGVGNATGSNGTVYVNGSTLYLDGEYTYVAGTEAHSSSTATNGATLDLRGGAALTVASNGLRGVSGGLVLDGTGTLSFTDWNSNESQIDIDRLTVSNVLANLDETVAGATTYRKWKKYPRYSLSIGNGGEVRVTNAVSLSHDLVISGSGVLTRNGTAGTAARSVICRALTTSQSLAFAPGETLTVSNSISLGSGVSVTANNNLAPDLTSSPVITVPAGASLCVTGNVAPANDGKLTINISGGTLVVTGKLDAVLTYNNHELELTAVNNARVTVGGNMRTAPNTATLNNTWIVSNSTLTVGGNLTGGTGNMDALGTNTFCGTSVVSVAGYVDQNRRKFFVSDTASLTVGGNAGALGMKLAASSGTALLVLSNSAALVVSNILEVGNASSVTSTNQFLLNNTATATVGGLVVGTNGTVKVNDSAVLTINSAPSFTNLSATIGLATGAKLYVLRSAFSTAQAEAAIAAGNIVPLGAPLRVGAISLAEVSFTEVSSTASSMQGTVFSIK